MGIRVRQGCIGAAVALMATTVVLAVGPPAGASPACSIVDQLTDTTDTDFPNSASSTPTGSALTFVGSGDYVGENPDGNFELFFVDTVAPEIVQVTGSTSLAVGTPELDDAGDLIAFVSSRNLAGDNADASQETFLYDTGTEAFTQVTDLAGQSTFEPTISGDGGTVAFSSTGDPTGDNADASQEVFVYDVGTQVITQVSDNPTGPTARVPSLSEDGDTLAYMSEGDELGTNADGGFEVFVHHVGTAQTEQITQSATQSSSSPSVSADGLSIAFSSSDDPFGTNADHTSEIFLQSDTGLSQLTISDEHVSFPLISGDGGRVLFHDTIDHAGENGDGSLEVFLADPARPGVGQVTHDEPPEGAFAVDQDETGSAPVLVADGDPLGTNGDGNHEFFRGLCGSSTPLFTDVGSTTAFFDEIQWMVAAGIASGFPGGIYKPMDPTNRQQMARFMYNLAGQPAFTPPVSPTFTDVPVTNAFYTEVEWMVAEGIATGYADDTYRPRQATNRQQMANFLYNLAGQPAFTPPGNPTFDDYPPNSVYYEAVEWMAAEDIADGFNNGTYRPRDPTNRQQMANFMHNFAGCCIVDV